MPNGPIDAGPIDTELATVVPLPQNEQATMGALLVAVNNLTGAVKENSRKVDNLTAEMNEIKSTFAVHQSQADAENVRQETAHVALNTRITNLEHRQDADEKLRSTSLKDELTALKNRLKTDEEHKESNAAKDLAHYRSRRNYWIGLVITFLLGLASTWFAVTLRNSPNDPQKKQHVIDKHKRPVMHLLR